MRPLYLKSLGFDEEPFPAEPLPETGLIEDPRAGIAHAEEADLIASPAADAEAGVLDWLEEPVAAEGLPEAEPLVDFGLDEEPVAAEPLDAASAQPDPEPIAPTPAMDDEMTAFWPGDASPPEPLLEGQASDEMDFDFGSEAEAHGAIAESLPSDDEPMFLDDDAVATTPEHPDESLDLELNFDAEPEAAGLEATEMYVAPDEAPQPALTEPTGFSDDDALASLDEPVDMFELADAKEVEEPVEFDFLAGETPTPAAMNEIETQEEPESLLPEVTKKAGARRKCRRKTG